MELHIEPNKRSIKGTGARPANKQTRIVEKMQRGARKKKKEKRKEPTCLLRENTSHFILFF